MNGEAVWKGLELDKNLVLSGTYLYKYSSGDQSGYYPLSGFRNGSKVGRLAATGARGAYWTALPYIKDQTLQGRSFRITTPSEVNFNAKYGMADGLAVRCQKD